MSGLRVIKPGPLTLLQDLGRVGFFRQGLTVGGPADLVSFLWANRLCGNRANTAALEIAVGGLVVESTADCQIAVTGGDADIAINGNPVRHWSSHTLRAGDRLDIGPSRKGLRLYLAVRGGFQVPRQFASAATVPREHVGGLAGNGAAIKAGDTLPCAAATGEANFYLPLDRQPDWCADSPLRLVPGWQYSQLPKTLRRQLLSRVFTLSNQSDRMGIRLTGEPLTGHQHIAEAMVSEGIVAGTVQIPTDGLPILMLVDHQTIGGYPKAGTLLRWDLSRLAQFRPGAALRFQPVSAVRARAINRRWWRQFEATAPIRA